MDSPLCCASTTVHKCWELRKVTLESHNYRVRTASSGETAMKMLEETSVVAVPTGVQIGRHGCGSRGLPD
jgi:hypothetical protein